MFPIDSNDAYRNSNGSLTTIGDKIGSGGGSDIPDYSISDAGKVLTVGEDGELEWNEKGEGGGAYESIIRPIWILPENTSITPKVGCVTLPIDTYLQRNYISSTTGSNTYTLEQLINFGNFECVELFQWFTDEIVEALNAVALFTGTDAVTEITLSDDFTDYDYIAIQGMYNTDYTNQYNTTIIYKNPSVNTSYWFGMLDRSTTYSGTLMFTDATHATLSESRRVRIFGFNK